MKTMQVLDRLVAVNLDVRIWSGRKKLTAEDLSLGADVPPEDLVSLDRVRGGRSPRLPSEPCVRVRTRLLT